MRTFALVLLALLPAAVPPSAAVRRQSGGKAGPLNVLFVMDDQHNPRMLGVDSNGYGGLNTSLTPSLDQLAAQGVRFARSYCTAPQCVPSRFSLLTGQDPHVSGVRMNGVWGPAGAVTWVELARRQGYRTATFGKHHLNWLDQPQVADDHGFEQVLDLEDYEAWCAAQGLPPYDHPSVSWYMHGMPAALASVGHTRVPNAQHPAGWFSDRTIEFLEQRAADQEPFVAWLSFYGPHTPILPSNVGPEDWAHRYFPYEDLELPPNQAKVSVVPRVLKTQAKYASMTRQQHREALAYYYGYVSQIDANVGRVLHRLEQLGLDHNTVVVFTADHGECGGEMSCWKKGAGCFECLVRVPLILRLPGVLPAGHESEVLASGVDLFPTLVELCGFSPAPAERQGVNGRSLLQVARDQQVPVDWDQRAFSALGHPDVPGLGRHRLVVTPQDKLNFDEVGGPIEEYYDLVNDPWELINRVGDPAYAPRVNLLRATLADWWGDEADHAPRYQVSGPPLSRPGRIIDPWPADGAVLLPTDLDLAWVPSTGAFEHELWFGTDPAQLSLFKVLPPMADGANLGTLAPGATYYWRVDGVNANGPQKGDVLGFSTDPAGDGGPGLGTAPWPEDRAKDVSAGSILSWSPAPGAVGQQVWFGLEGQPMTVIASGGAGLTAASPPPVAGGRTYRWRIDARDAVGLTEGDLWSFTVSEAGLAERPTSPTPRHLAHGVSLPLGTRLRWEAAPGATEYRVSFGTDFPLPLVHEGAQVGWAPGPLELGRVYYWRVDAVNARGVRRGKTWRFESDG